jgi:hypothetical protein
MKKAKPKLKISSENLTNMCKKNAVFGKYVDVPTDCVGNRNTSCRGTGLRVTMNRKDGDT